MQKEQEILALVEKYIKDQVFAGAHFAVLEQENVKEYVLGKAWVYPQKEKLTNDKSWDLASVTKVVGTGTAVIDLILSGQIALDQPLSKYYPAFENDQVTIRQLLTHSTGIDPFIPNRDELDKSQLISAINQIKVTENKTFKYTDINFILLGFMLEKFYQEDLDTIFKEQIFKKWKMNETSFGPVEKAVPSSPNIPLGTVHDPKAQVLGRDCGSAGLFSTMADLIKFVQGYFSEEKYLELLKNYSFADKKRSLAWDLPAENNDWLLHTGYTGTFILLNPRSQKAVIFLSNRVYFKDERKQWIKERDFLIRLFIDGLEQK